MLKSILYVSHSKLLDEDADGQVHAIVDLAQTRNVELQVTGVLLYTGARFAQLMEGPAQSVDTLMARIARDERHDRITMLQVSRPSVRRFDEWAMAYAGRSTYVDRHLRALLQDVGEAERRDGCEALIELMWALNNTRVSS